MNNIIKVIHCPTKELAVEVLNILYNKGYKWINDNILDVTNWEQYDSKTCYSLRENSELLGYCEIEYYKNNCYKITEAEEFIKENMKQKEIKIEVPEGYEIDKENSTFECIKFKSKKLAYSDICDELFKSGSSKTLVTSCISDESFHKIAAFIQLLNVAKYLNGNWKPNFTSTNNKHYIYITDGKYISFGNVCRSNDGAIYFKTEKLAKQAVDILGEETIKLALS